MKKSLCTIVFGAALASLAGCAGGEFPCSISGGIERDAAGEWQPKLGITCKPADEPAGGTP